MTRNEDLSFERDKQIVHITNALCNNSKDLYDLTLTLTLDELSYLLKVAKEIVQKTPHIVRREFVGNNVGGVGDVKAYFKDNLFEWEELKFTKSNKNDSHGGGGVKLTQAFSKNIISFSKYDKKNYPKYFKNLGVNEKKSYHKEWRKRRNFVTNKYNLSPKTDGSLISKKMYELYPETDLNRKLFGNLKKDYSVYFSEELLNLPPEHVLRVCNGLTKGLRKPKDLDNFTLENSKYILREINVTNMGTKNIKTKIKNFVPKKSITKITPNSQQTEIHFCDKTKLSFPLSQGNGGQGSLETYTLKVFFEA
tara:strand:+ start:127 stop:1050 length:924 start_codon:yes stop_codon:yes gene_type:complete